MGTVYEIVQDRILKRLEEAIEKGENFQWVKPWGNFKKPRNFVSKENYRGINLLLLPYGGNYLTMKQVNNLKGSVIKGSKSFPVVYWASSSAKPKEEEGDEEKDKKKSFIFKYYNVFHQSQIEGIDFNIENEENTLCENDLINEVECLTKKYNDDECEITTVNSNMACYYPGSDRILIPEVNQYKNI